VLNDSNSSSSISSGSSSRLELYYLIVRPLQLCRASASSVVLTEQTTRAMCLVQVQSGVCEQVNEQELCFLIDYDVCTVCVVHVVAAEC
jgi:hypothetical protein